jgi:hypothetical protein
LALLLLTQLIGLSLAHADSSGFHYIPLRSNLEHVFRSKRPIEFEFQTLIAQLSESVYGGTGSDTTMVGFGVLGRVSWSPSSMVTVSPEYGLDFFVGNPVDVTGSKRPLLSLQVPLALHYTIQLYRDDRLSGNTTLDPQLNDTGKNLKFYFGPLLPLVLDVTTDGFTTSGDFGVQVGTSYAWPWGNNLFAMQGAVAKFLTGYFYNNDLNQDNLEEITGEPLDLAGGFEWLYLPWRFGLASDFHWTSSLADIQGDTVYIGSLRFLYYPN